MFIFTCIYAIDKWNVPVDSLLKKLENKGRLAKAAKIVEPDRERELFHDYYYNLILDVFYTN
jgi:hypothetical protein